MHNKLTSVIICLCLFLGAAVVSAADIADLEDRVSNLEMKIGKMKVYFGGDFRVRYDNTEWDTQKYMQPNMEGTYDPMPAMNFKNSECYSWRLRLKMGADINENLKFHGRLDAYKLFGGAEVPVFNGTPQSMHHQFNSTRIPTDNVVRIERAYFTYVIPDSPFIFTVGRQAATDGPPREIKLNSARQGTPISLLIDAELDGLMAGLQLDELGLPDGSRFRVCYGVGFEAGFGGGGEAQGLYVINPMGVGRVADLEDNKVMGGCFDIPIMLGFTEALFCGSYFKVTDLTDIGYATTRNFPNPMNNNPQNVTATANLGDMEMYGFSWAHTTDWFTYFLSMGWNKSDPNGQVSAYGFGGLLGNPDSSESGSAWYAGIQIPLQFADASIGVEYNHGDEHWWSYTPAADDVSNKLATRGDVLEIYMNYNVDKHLMLQAGYVAYDYDYAFSGWHIAPADLDYFELSENPGMPYPFPDKVDNFYVSATVRF